MLELCLNQKSLPNSLDTGTSGTQDSPTGGKPMASSMLVHDRRLAGNPPGNLADNTYRVDATVPIAHAIGWIAEYARRSGGLTDLYVMCHGFESTANYGQQMSMNTAARGGFGLQLCTEGLSLYNATLASAFKTGSARSRFSPALLPILPPTMLAPQPMACAFVAKSLYGATRRWSLPLKHSTTTHRIAPSGNG
jgi:hypothetical protein